MASHGPLPYLKRFNAKGKTGVEKTTTSVPISEITADILKEPSSPDEFRIYSRAFFLPKHPGNLLLLSMNGEANVLFIRRLPHVPHYRAPKEVVWGLILAAAALRIGRNPTPESFLIYSKVPILGPRLNQAAQGSP